MSIPILHLSNLTELEKLADRDMPLAITGIRKPIEYNTGEGSFYIHRIYVYISSLKVLSIPKIKYILLYTELIGDDHVSEIKQLMEDRIKQLAEHLKTKHFQVVEGLWRASMESI